MSCFVLGYINFPPLGLNCVEHHAIFPACQQPLQVCIWLARWMEVWNNFVRNFVSRKAQNYYTSISGQWTTMFGYTEKKHKLHKKPCRVKVQQFAQNSNVTFLPTIMWYSPPTTMACSAACSSKNANPLGSARVGSEPILVANCYVPREQKKQCAFKLLLKQERHDSMISEMVSATGVGL